MVCKIPRTTPGRMNKLLHGDDFKVFANEQEVLIRTRWVDYRFASDSFFRVWNTTAYERKSVDIIKAIIDNVEILSEKYGCDYVCKIISRSENRRNAQIKSQASRKAESLGRSALCENQT